jgi:hypothetical protein
MLEHLSEFVDPFIPAPKAAPQPSRRDAAVALITCVLVVIIGSMSNPIFVTSKKRHCASTCLPLPLAFDNFPLRQLPENMPREDRLLAMQREATRVGIPSFGEVLTAEIFKDLQIYVMPLLHKERDHRSGSDGA